MTAQPSEDATSPTQPLDEPHLSLADVGRLSRLLSSVPLQDTKAPALPLIPQDHAERLGLVDPHDLARAFNTNSEAMKATLRKDSAPTPVGLTAQTRYGRHLSLYILAEVIRWADGDRGPETIGGRRHSAPVRRVGTSTPTAGTPYRWRDAARPAHAPKGR